MSIKVDDLTAISVIVPVYNVQDYLPECLASLANQTFSKPYQILLIDDCSTDDSKSICEDFVRTNPSLAKLIYLRENSGVSVARNTGISAATGTYFTFVDSDDRLPATALQQLYDAAIKHKADIVKGNNLIFNEVRCRSANHNVKKEKIYEGEAILSAFLQHKEVRGHTWGKLFCRASFAHILNPPKVTMAEDTLYCAEVFSKAKKLVLITDTVYHYRLRPSGATGRKFQTGAYLWWLHSIESCGHFVSNATQQRHLKALQIRTLLQLVREARHLKTKDLSTILPEVTARQRQWQLDASPRRLVFKISPKFLFDFLKFKLQLNHLKHRLRYQNHANITH